MTINLESFVDKKVKVTLRDTKIREGIIKYYTNKNNRKVFFIRLSHYDLIDFDKEGNNNYDSRLSIIHIEEISMTDILSNYVDKEVFVTLRNGCKNRTKIIKTHANQYKYHLVGSSHTYNGDGRYNLDSTNSPYDIVKIEEIPMNTEQILKEINKTQEQLNKLQEELKKAEEKEKFNKKFFTPIEHEKEYQSCLKLLKTKNTSYIIQCFAWDKTPQGIEYWEDISGRTTHLAEYDIQQIKDWVINYLIQKEL